MPLGSIIVLIGIACVIGAIIGGGVKLSLPSGGGVDAPAIQSLRRQILLSLFGLSLIVAGAAINSGIPLSSWLKPEQKEDSGTITKRAPERPSDNNKVSLPPPDLKKEVETTIKSDHSKESPNKDISQIVPVAASSKDSKLNSKLGDSEKFKKVNLARKGLETDIICKLYSGYNATSWRDAYLRPAISGTWHVFVFSFPVGSTESEAEASTENWRRRFRERGLNFDPIETVNDQSQGNDRWGILLASGIDESTARKIARFADQCGVAKGAFALEMVRGVESTSSN